MVRVLDLGHRPVPAQLFQGLDVEPLDEIILVRHQVDFNEHYRWAKPLVSENARRAAWDDSSTTHIRGPFFD